MNRYPPKPPRHTGPGRHKGIPNKITTEVRDLARKLLADKAYRQSLRRRLVNGTLGALEIVLWQYAYGKPKDTIELSHADDDPASPQVVFYIPDNHRNGNQV
jgi:hypothetical protein